MVQPDFLAIRYEELCDTNPSKPTRAPWHARWTPSANGGLCSSSVMPSVAYGASPIFRRAWDWRALRKLVACGIMEQVPASDGSAYREYALTQKGRELFPVIVALRQWGESHFFSRGEKRFQVLDKRTGKPFRVQVHNAKGEILTANDLELVTVKN